MEFLNRTDDLDVLLRRWDGASAELLIVWGRRRVGKTELLAHFARDRRGFLFEATSGTVTDQLRDFSRVLAEATGSPLLREQALTSWNAAFAALEQFITERTLIVLDEFQYLAQADPGLASLLSRWWRERGRDLPLMLVLSGSEVSFFERDVLGHGSPLYGRRTGQLQLAPFGHTDAALFTPDWPAEDRIRAYAVFGGMPYYLSQIDPAKSLADNIARTALARDGILREEVRLLLFQELPDPRLHFSVLRALAGGDTRVSQISNRIGLDTSAVSRVLDSLSSLLLVRRVVPVTATLRARTKQTTWEILDPYVRFWFRFVLPYEDRLQSPAGQAAHLETTILPALDDFVAKPTFEHVAQAYMRRRLNASDVGTWWGKVPTGQARLTETREVDVVALDGAGAVTALGSCKWTARPVGLSEESLLSRLEPHIIGESQTGRPAHWFFSRSGFEEGLRRLAESDPGRYVLVGLEDLYE